MINLRAQPRGRPRLARSRKFWRETAWAYALLAPALLVIALFHLYPLLRSVQLSLFDWNFVRPQQHFIGLQNYKEILQDPVFWKAVRNTFIYVIGTVPIEIALALSIAALLNRKLTGIGLYRIAFFLPHITTVVAIAAVWRWLYHEEYGLFNQILPMIGLDPVMWLRDPFWTMPTIILMSVWKSLGYTAMIFLAGLQGLDKELGNAARIDGANPVQVFRYVTWPLLTPTTFFVSITSIIGAFKVFSEVFVLYGGTPGPLREGITLVFYVYEKAWGEYKMGYASAGALLLFLLVMAISGIQFWYARQRVHYD
ncbi:MAG TPA: sugar ABC transporter permease [Symbiobacteriaceae bacterium]|nr:sugar ABC transporter permease [Symbiobacteriaceae bacterium]